LAEYEARATQLKEELPTKRKRCDRLRAWIDLLKSQKAQLDAERTDTKLMSHQERKAVVYKGLNERRRKTQE
jgi:hypothetical protein